MGAPRELPTDRLATSDERGRRIYLYPAEVAGRFRRYRTRVHSFLIVVFLLLPWVRIGGHQAILLDIAGRRFAIFGITFWAHDAPMLAFLIGGAALTLGLVTAVSGRAWCGWACPQTVFIERVFRSIERLIEGDHFARRKLDAGDWTVDRVFKKGLKWTCFTGATLVVAHSFVAYFVGTDALARMVRRPPSENPASFSIMLGISALMLFDFGWFREQFCTVLCPYGRFQSLLMDEHSQLVAYDAGRGEPRRGAKPEGQQAGRTSGDCVDCFRCVQVCPTGIDIRRGAQLECVACTACIDACDDVMSRLRKPAGLIRHDSAIGLRGGVSKIVRARTVVYAMLIVAIVAGLAATVASRRPIEAAFVRAVDTPYQQITNSQGSSEIINHFKADLKNQSFADAELDLVPSADSAGQGVEIVIAARPVRLLAGTAASAEFFVKFPKTMLSSGHSTLKLRVMNHSSEISTEELNLVGPYL